MILFMCIHVGVVGLHIECVHFECVSLLKLLLVEVYAHITIRLLLWLNMHKLLCRKWNEGVHSFSY